MRTRNVSKKVRSVTGPMEKMMHGAENAERQGIWVLTVLSNSLHEQFLMSYVLTYVSRGDGRGCMHVHMRKSRSPVVHAELELELTMDDNRVILVYRVWFST